MTCKYRVLIVFGLLGAGFGMASPSAAVPDQLAQEVRSLLENHCVQCHGPSQQLNGLRLDSREGAIEGGYSGPSLVLGDGGASALIRRLTSDDPTARMPLAAPPLHPDQIKVLTRWIDQGAPWPRGTMVRSDSDSVFPKQDRHWSFRPIDRPRTLPESPKPWDRSPIDSLIRNRLEQEGVAPSPMAPKETLIRRVSLDLTGLLPSVEEVEAFLADERPDAYERLVDRLLASPRYGEKWARHWLDLARYADSDGYEKDLLRPHAWRWRQWVIQALNRDLSFDEFTIEQLAGDLLPEASVEQRVATGFLRSGLKNREAGVPRGQVRFEETVDQTNTMGTVWLGLTLGCAQCHDHKYDPLSQKEYYQFLAFFNQTQAREMDAPLPGEMEPYLEEFPRYRQQRKELLDNGEISIPRLQARWETMLLEAAEHPGKHLDWDDILRGAILNELDRALELFRSGPAGRTWRENDRVTHYFFKYTGPEIARDEALSEKLKDLKGKLAELETSFPDVTRAYVIQDMRAATHIALRGDYRAPGVQVQPGTPAWLPSFHNGMEPPRLRLARWLVDEDNPLTARVAANRFWQELFGSGLVRTPEDYGIQGSKPSHPALLDWLGSEFMRQEWSRKQMLRRLVTSATYRQASRVERNSEEMDPENVLLARQSRLRLSAELIRDAALSAAGVLDSRVGGKSVRPPQPDWVSEITYGKSDWESSSGADRFRRGLYVLFKRSAPYPQMVNFDAPDASATVCRRDRSNTALQALNLLNDPVFLEAARFLAVRTLREAPPRWEDRLHLIYHLCLSREPGPAELRRFRRFFERQRAIFQEEPESVKDLAAGSGSDLDSLQVALWTTAARAVLNLDEFITRE
ncbi:MAG: PSD1 and planctomycete cytochrome C domain-containing protein [Acidobacteriota bacterium]|nr:PSD1 and planctomycete cytochrome C domain-containing protein [Acidobacteriota bacterium]